MGKLFIMYDTETRQFSGASFGGKYLYGVGSVVLNQDGVSVRDHDGRDLLAAGGETPPGDPAQPTGVQQGIAACFGADDTTTPTETDADDDLIDRWDFNRWSK